MKRFARIAALLLLFAGLQSAHAAEVVQFDDPAKRALYQSLLAELRCTVCQNQNLLDSGAGLADDLRRQVYTMVSEGATRDEVVEFMVARYGEFVLYRPPVKKSTYALWFAPFILLATGIVSLVVMLRRRGSAPPPPPVDRQQLDRLLKK